MHDAGPSRRTVLAGLGALALGLGATACDSGGGSGPGPDQRKADDQARVRARAAAVALLDRYDAVIAAYPALAGRLRPYSDEVGRHLAALGGTRPTVPPSTPPEPVPAGEQAAVADLAAREQRAADDRMADLPAVGPQLARTIASISASQTVHARSLGSPS